MPQLSSAQAVITAMIAPALLMASASLIATARVRLARIVDRVRDFRSWGDTGHAEELVRSERLRISLLLRSPINLRQPSSSWRRALQLPPIEHPAIE